MSDTRLLIVRHGETTENVAAILQGHLPGHLTPRGRAQAAALREELRGQHFEAFMSSDLARAVETARILAPVVQCPLRLTPLLRERDWGSLTGKPIAEVRGMDFPPDVESVEALFARAHSVLTTLAHDYAGQRVLVVTHGLFARCLRAVNAGQTIRDTPRMDNATAIELTINAAIALTVTRVSPPHTLAATAN